MLRGSGASQIAEGALRPVDRFGNFWSPAPAKEGGESRPPEFSPFMWWSVFNRQQRLDYWADKAKDAGGGPAAGPAIGAPSAALPHE